jgi:DNA-binding response OmpR family regulator
MDEARGLIVIVEDEPVIAELERRYLNQAGFGVHVASDGVIGLADIRRLSPVAAVVDVGLPGIDGTELVRRMRADDDWTPVIFVTAHDGEIDRVLGLELGGDDYLTKPFSPRELVARVRSLVRRAAGPGGARVLRFEELEVDSVQRVVRVAGQVVELTATEFDLLVHLLARPRQVFTREQLLSAVWGVADYVGSRTVDVHIAQLRAKLGGTDPVRTVRGVGYGIRSFDG